MSDAFAGHQPVQVEGFVAGFSGTAAGVAQALQAAFAPSGGFAPRDIRERVRGPVGFAPAPAQPRHFEPADPDRKPTEGWDPFDAAPSTPEHPFVDPLVAARDAGFAEGYAAALAEAETEMARDRQLIERLGAALAEENRVDREAIARALRQTVLLLVKRTVGDTGVSPQLLQQRIDSAAALLADAAESAILRLNPDDVPLLDGRLPATIFAVGDEGIARGSFVLEAASTIVEDGPELWLEQLTAAIDRVALPA